MTKDTCISISVLAKKPGSVVLPPLLKKNKKVFLFFIMLPRLFPPLYGTFLLLSTPKFCRRRRAICFWHFQNKESLWEQPVYCSIVVNYSNSSSRFRAAGYLQALPRAKLDTLCRIQNLEFIIPMLLYSSLEVTVGAESRIRLPIVGPAISQKCRNTSVNDNNRSSVKITAEHVRGTLPIMGTCYDPAASDLKWVIALFAIFHIKVCLFIIVGQGLLHMQKLCQCYEAPEGTIKLGGLICVTKCRTQGTGMKH